MSVISEIKTGKDEQAKSMDLCTLFDQYLEVRCLKPTTVKDYKEIIRFYLGDWKEYPVSSITKKMVEKRFNLIRDKGVQGGKPTHSQAAKTMRILSALMNYAKGDDLIEVNPVEILTLKKVDRSIPRKTSYLRLNEVLSLLEKTSQDNHPCTLSILLMLHTGLRKNEALGIEWTDIKERCGLWNVKLTNEIQRV